ncbi:ABC-type nickel/cobalt efflux system permease component RcnA [Catenuloplanes nepalensis]|uniref:ABC-type nickel/cobalt efflux system permease component RcnA n=1 Tax=Catenuloplanes nepalensis TaxID=587533 RepID=A0ABT9MSX5_9ACTN|nr:hypothetical protein [Catenuloplanes nepalensis]MDP9794371.1 ABC-type nickel/cobalt efflux system permease component RcnA [Catenuloplanes nepalensis]
MRSLMLVAGVVAVALWPAAPASAHPLGNLSTNQYVGVTVRPDRIEALAVLDLAELPTLQGTAPDCTEFASAITLRVDGRPVPWRVSPLGLEHPLGDGGLRTSRLTCALSVDQGPSSTLEIINGYAPERAGWHEMTATAVDGMRLLDPPIPAASVSDVLRTYPADPLAASPSVRSAALRVAPGTSVPAPGVVPATTGAAVLGEWFASAEASFQRLAAGRLTPLVGVLAVLLALALGAGHAALPGHGKLVMAGYALSSESFAGALGRARRVRDAAVVVGTVTASHTGGVLVAGLLLTATSLVGERVLAALGTASGLLVLAVGISMFRRRPGHDHGPGGHTHGSAGHVHHHGPGGRVRNSGDQREHASEDAGHDHGRAEGAVAVLTRPAATESAPDVPHGHGHGVERRGLGLAGIGLAGGLVPSPSAVVVLLGAIGLGRTAFGVLLVIAYGIGMAATLTFVGLALSALRRRLGRLPGLPQPIRRLSVLVPRGTAVLVMLVGSGMAARAALMM